jgi:NAD(P)-dependent dehydrogenase (short-subunit alcohol dehydrogenase family)
MSEGADRWVPPDLLGTVVCVAGASYGVGRAIAEVLGQCRATVYVTGRSTRKQPTKDRRWTVEDTAELVDAGGGRGVPLRVDHTSENDVRSLFKHIEDEGRGLDLLVNNVWQWGPPDEYESPTWEQPVGRWDAMFGVGVRAHFLTTRYALPLLLARPRSLIVSTQERPGDAEHFGQNIVVDSAAVAMQRMIEYLAEELADTGVTALLVYLGWVRTVNRGMGIDLDRSGMSQTDFEAMTQSPYLVGRAIAELFADQDLKARSGATIYAGQVALEYGFTDIDGRVPAYDGGELASGERVAGPRRVRR